jgi:hypothetical protein
MSDEPHDLMQHELRATIGVITDDPTTEDRDIPASISIVLTQEGLIIDLVRDSDGEVVGSFLREWCDITDDIFLAARNGLPA